MCLKWLYSQSFSPSKQHPSTSSSSTIAYASLINYKCIWISHKSFQLFFKVCWCCLLSSFHTWLHIDPSSVIVFSTITSDYFVSTINNRLNIFLLSICCKINPILTPYAYPTCFFLLVNMLHPFTILYFFLKVFIFISISYKDFAQGINICMFGPCMVHNFKIEVMYHIDPSSFSSICI